MILKIKIFERKQSFDFIMLIYCKGFNGKKQVYYFLFKNFIFNKNSIFSFINFINFIKFNDKLSAKESNILKKNIQ